MEGAVMMAIPATGLGQGSSMEGAAMMAVPAVGLAPQWKEGLYEALQWKDRS